MSNRYRIDIDHRLLTGTLNSVAGVVHPAHAEHLADAMPVRHHADDAQRPRESAPPIHVLVPVPASAA